MKSPPSTKQGQSNKLLTMVTFAVLSILFTYTCSAPPLIPRGQLWGSNTFSSAQNCLFLPQWQKSKFGAGCWHITTTTCYTTTQTDHLKLRSTFGPSSQLPSPPLPICPHSLPPTLLVFLQFLVISPLLPLVLWISF